MTIETPCIRLCRLEPEHGLCVGCGRSGEEIAGWSGFSPARRRSVMRALPARMEALAPSRAQGSGHAGR